MLGPPRSSQEGSSGGLRRQLEALAAHACQEAAAPEGGCASLRDLLPRAPSPASSRAAHVLPQLAVGTPPAPAEVLPALPSVFLQAVHALPPAATGGGAARAAAPAAQQQQLFRLEAPVLQASLTAARPARLEVGAPTSAFAAQLFLPAAVPRLEPSSACFAPSGCQPVSLAALMAQDLVLEGGGLTLPPVVLERDSGDKTEGERGRGSAAVGGRCSVGRLSRGIVQAIQLPIPLPVVLPACLLRLAALPDCCRRLAAGVHRCRLRLRARQGRASGALPRLVGV